MLSLITWGTIEHNRFLKKSLELENFISQTEINAAVAKAEKARKERQYEVDISNALSARDTAVSKLHKYKADITSRRVSGSPETTGSNSKVCWGTERFNLALRELEGIIAEGQVAVINSQSLLEAWPR